MVEIVLSVSFAGMSDLSWIVENDTHIPKEIIERKIQVQEYLIAKVSGEPVGCLRFGLFWSMIPFIEVIWVEDRFHRRGIGRELVRCLEDYARSQGQKIIMSSSQADEPEAQAFHRGIGFRDAGALIDMRPLQSVAEVFFVKNTE
jgi:ribosomal protein S18 acetylase RimI-like enzyme